MILKITEINPETAQSIRILLFKDLSGYAVCIEGKSKENLGEFVELRPPFRFHDQEFAIAKFYSLIEELKYVYDE